MGEPWGLSAQDAILCQNGRKSHEKPWNHLHIYLKSGVIVIIIIIVVVVVVVIIIIVVVVIIYFI